MHVASYSEGRSYSGVPLNWPQIALFQSSFQCDTVPALMYLKVKQIYQFLGKRQIVIAVVLNLVVFPRGGSRIFIGEGLQVLGTTFWLLKGRLCHDWWQYTTTQIAKCWYQYSNTQRHPRVSGYRGQTFKWACFVWGPSIYYGIIRTRHLRKVCTGPGSHMI